MRNCLTIITIVLSFVLSLQIKAQERTILASSEFEAPIDTVVIDVKEVNEVKIDTSLFFKPCPNKALWRAAIFPGLGQIYNRKYWKLPIVYGGFMALTYAVTWNNKYYTDYSIAYRDLMDSNPETNSYLNFLPPGSDESSYSKEWLRSTFKRKNDYYRRSRDLSIIGMLGVYLVSILDAYVDAQLYDFDVSPDLSLHIEPTIVPQTQTNDNMVGLRLSFNF